jgi:hypothetical protein
VSGPDLLVGIEKVMTTAMTTGESHRKIEQNQNDKMLTFACNRRVARTTCLHSFGQNWVEFGTEVGTKVQLKFKFDLPASE